MSWDRGKRRWGYRWIRRHQGRCVGSRNKGMVGSGKRASSRCRRGSREEGMSLVDACRINNREDPPPTPPFFKGGEPNSRIGISCSPPCFAGRGWGRVLFRIPLMPETRQHGTRDVHERSEHGRRKTHRRGLAEFFRQCRRESAVLHAHFDR